MKKQITVYCRDSNSRQKSLEDISDIILTLPKSENVAQKVVRLGRDLIEIKHNNPDSDINLIGYVGSCEVIALLKFFGVSKTILVASQIDKTINYLGDNNVIKLSELLDELSKTTGLTIINKNDVSSKKMINLVKEALV